MAKKSPSKSTKKPVGKLSEGSGIQGMPGATDDFWYGGDLHSTRRSDKATPNTIQKIATAYACVDVYGKTMGMLPGSVFKKKSGGGKDLLNKHALYRVLRKPNALMDRVQFWQLKERTQILYGNFYAQKIYNGFGELSELRPIHPTIVKVKQIGNYDVEYEIETDKGTKIIAREDMFHTKEPGEDGIIGRSRIQIVAASFEMALSLLAQNKALSENDSRPLGLLSPAAPIKDDEQKNKLIASWENAHKGPRKSGRVAVVPFGVTYTQLGITPRDAQLMEMLLVYGVDSVNTIFDVPPYRTQDFRRATFSNVDAADQFWKSNSVTPRVVATEAAIESQLLSEKERESGIFVKFNIDAFFRADIKTRYDAYHVAIADGWLSRKEVRELEDWDPAEDEHGLGEFLAPTNMTTAKAMNKAAEAPPEEEETPSNEGEKPEEEPEKEAKSDKEALSALLKEPLKRLILKEKRAISKALKKEDWEKESEIFYEKHKKHMFEAIEAGLLSFKSATDKLIGFTEMDEDINRAILAHLTDRAQGVALNLEILGLPNVVSYVNRWDSADSANKSIELIVKELLNYER